MTKTKTNDSSDTDTIIDGLTAATAAHPDALSSIPSTNPYIKESTVFRRLIEQKREEAMRIIRDLELEIERFETEIAARRERITDLMAEIVARADAALSLNTGTASEIPLGEFNIPEFLQR